MRETRRKWGMGGNLLFERYCWFYRKVRDGDYPNATALAGKFEISTKTARRSITLLKDRIDCPIEYDRVKKGYYLTDPSFEMPTMWLRADELVALFVSNKLLKEVAGGWLSDELEHLSDKLSNLLSESILGKITPEEAFSFLWTEISPTPEETFQTVCKSLLGGRLMNFDYYAPSTDSRTNRSVEPHHLLNYMGNWHLIAFCRLRGTWRDFNLSRMSNCRMEKGEFVFRPETEWKPFLTDSFGIFQGKKSFSVVLEFDERHSRWVRGQVWHHAQEVKELPSGGLRLSFPASHKEEVFMEILKHGSGVKVLEPTWLREEVRKEIDKMQATYETP